MGIILDSLQEKLDPIDWATYEAYLWANECRFYHRSAVLLGHLVGLHRLYSDAPQQRQPFSADSNTLHMAVPAPRFTYLPISTPAMLSNGHLPPGAKDKRSSAVGLSMHDTPLLFSPGAGAAAGRGGGGGFTQSPFGSHFDGGARFLFGDDSSTGSGLTSTPIFKSFIGQIGSNVKLGSLMSDGAAVGRNISTFGEMLPSQAAGLFSSLTTGAMNPTQP